MRSQPPSRDSGMKYGTSGKPIYIDMWREDDKVKAKFFVKNGLVFDYMNFAAARKKNSVYNKMVETQKKKDEYQAKLLKWEKDREERRREIAAYASGNKSAPAKKTKKAATTKKTKKTKKD